MASFEMVYEGPLGEDHFTTDGAVEMVAHLAEASI